MSKNLSSFAYTYLLKNEEEITLSNTSKIEIKLLFSVKSQKIATIKYGHFWLFHYY